MKWRFIPIMLVVGVLLAATPIFAQIEQSPGEIPPSTGADTLIPLSIAYIDAEGRIVDIQDMQPLDETSRPSAEPAQYALEVNQDFFEGRGVMVGDLVELPPGQGEGGEGEVPTKAPAAPLGGQLWGFGLDNL